METLYKQNSGILVNGKRCAFPTFASMVYMDGQGMTLTDYLEHIVEQPKTTVVAYTITVPTDGWTNETLSWGGVSYTRKCVVSAPNAMADPVDVEMKYAGGDYNTYCQIGLIETGNGQVTLWSQTDPESTCQIRVVEIRRQGAQTDAVEQSSKCKQIMITSYDHSVALYDENGVVHHPEEGTVQPTDYLSVAIEAGTLSIQCKTNGQLSGAFAIYDTGTGTRMAYKSLSDPEPLSLLRTEGAVYIVHFALA